MKSSFITVFEKKKKYIRKALLVILLLKVWFLTS